MKYNISKNTLIQKKKKKLSMLNFLKKNRILTQKQQFK